MARFHRVDVVLYVEGGDESYCLHEVLRGMASSTSHDVQFWERVRDALSIAKRVRVRSVGSKSVLLEMLAMLEDHGIETVLLAADADFDHLTGGGDGSRYLMRTWGYSWESDVWSPEVFSAVVRLFGPVSTDDTTVEEACDLTFQSLEEGAKEAVRTEIATWEYDLMVWNRKSWERYVDRRGTVPCLAQGQVAEAIEQAQAGVASREKVRTCKALSDGDELRFLFGHLMASFMDAGVRACLRRTCGIKTVPKEAIQSAAISAFSTVVLGRPEHPIFLHYRGEFARVGLLAA